MTKYTYPTNSRAVSDSFADHVERGSVNPGTDYICYRTPVYAVAAGVVTDADGNPSGSGGRMIHIDHDDGTGADYLHLDALSVSAGDRVKQGQKIAVSGNSGQPVGGGSYGFHLHISFRPNHSHGYGNVGNLDFDAMMRAETTAADLAAELLEDDVPTYPLTIISDGRSLVQWATDGMTKRQLAPGDNQLLADMGKVEKDADNHPIVKVISKAQLDRIPDLKP